MVACAGTIVPSESGAQPHGSQLVLSRGHFQMLELKLHLLQKPHLAARSGCRSCRRSFSTMSVAVFSHTTISGEPQCCLAFDSVGNSWRFSANGGPRLGASNLASQNGYCR